MIASQTVVKGEPDLPPFTNFLEFQNQDEVIFENKVEMVKNKISRNLRLNVHETLVVYFAYIVGEIRSGKSDSEITRNSKRVLSRENVLIGVPETLRDISFDVTVDDFPKRTIRIIDPIPVQGFTMEESVHVLGDHL